MLIKPSRPALPVAHPLSARQALRQLQAGFALTSLLVWGSACSLGPHLSGPSSRSSAQTPVAASRGFEDGVGAQARIFGSVQGDFVKALLKGNAAGVAEALRQGADPLQRVPLGVQVASEVADLPVVVALARRDFASATLIARGIRPGALNRDQLDEILALAAAVDAQATESALRSHLGRLRYGNLQISATPGSDLEIDELTVLGRTGGVEADQIAWTAQARFESELKGKSLETALMAEAIRRLAGEKTVQKTQNWIAEAQAGMALLEECFKPQGLTASLEERLRAGAQTLGNQVKKLDASNPFGRVLANMAGDLVSQFAMAAGSEFLGGGSFDQAFWKRQEQAILGGLWKEARKNPWVAQISDGVFGKILSGKIQDSAAALLKKADSSPVLQFLLGALDSSGNLKISVPDLEAKLHQMQGQLSAYGKEQIQDLQATLGALPNASEFKSKLPSLTPEQLGRLQNAAERERFYAEASATLGLATDLMGALGVDQKTVRKVATIGQAGISLARGIDQTIQAFSSAGLSVGMNLATAALACNVVGVASSVIGLLSGTPSQEQMIMEALGQISEQIGALGEHMDARFDALEKQVAHGFRVVSEQLNVITQELGKVNYRLAVIERGIGEVNQKLDDISLRLSEQREILTARMNAGFEREWPRTLAKCQKENLSAGEFEECFALAISRSVHESRDALALDQSKLTLPGMGAPRRAWDQIEPDRQFLSALDALRSVTPSLPSVTLNDHLIGNRTTWAQGANLALDLLEADSYRARPEQRAQLETLWTALEQFESLQRSLVANFTVPNQLISEVERATTDNLYQMRRTREAGVNVYSNRSHQATPGVIESLGQIREYFGGTWHLRRTPILTFEKLPLPGDTAEVLSQALLAGTLNERLKSVQYRDLRSEKYQSLAFYVMPTRWTGAAVEITIRLVAFTDPSYGNYGLNLGTLRYSLPDPRFAPMEWKPGEYPTPAQASAFEQRVRTLLLELKTLPASALVGTDDDFKRMVKALEGPLFETERLSMAQWRNSLDDRLGREIERLRLWSRLVIPETSRRAASLAQLFVDSGKRSPWRTRALEPRALAAQDVEEVADEIWEEFESFSEVLAKLVAETTFDSEFPHLAALKTRLKGARHRLARISQRTEPAQVLQGVAQSPTVLKGKI